MPPDFISDQEFMMLQGGEPPDFIPDSAFQPAAPQKSAFEQYVYDPAGQVLQGLTFGFGDEITARAGQLVGRDHDTELATQRADNARFEQENPYTSVGLQLAGGLAPAALTGGASTPASAGSLSRALRAIYGIGKPTAGATIAGRIGRAAGTGAAAGGLYGAGSAEGGPMNRIVGAGQGAAAGGIIGGGIGAGAAGAEAVLTSRPAQRLYDAMGDMSSELATESGKVGAGGRAASSQPLSAADASILRKLRGRSPEELELGEQELSTAVAENSPLFLAEALKSPRLTRHARFVANYEPSMEMAQTAIEDRAKGAGQRVTGILDELSPERNPFTGAEAFRQGAEDTVDKVKGARRQMSKPLYEQAEEAMPIIDSPEIREVLTSKTVKSIIKNLKDDFPSQYGDLPDNHFRILDKVKKQLDGEIQAKARNGENADVVRDLKVRRDQLVDAIDNAGPEYEKARDMFRAFSGPVNYLEGQAREPGLLTSILKTKDNNVLSAVTSTFNENANPQRVASIREAMEIAGKGDEFKAGVRAFLQHMVRTTDDGKNAVADFIDNPAQRDILKAALGDGYESFARKIERETKIWKGKREYHAGSSTVGNAEEAADSLQALSTLGRFIKGATQPKQTAIQMADWMAKNVGPSAGTAEDLARALFNSPEGLATLRRIKPYHRRVSALGAALDRGQSLGARTGAQESRIRKGRKS